MENTLKGSDYIYKNPQKRAEDLMNAFKDKSIKGIFSCIGGDESIRILPYIDYDIIRKNPKVFIGYSDTTVSHFICLKAGISSFYGPSVLAEFAENVKMFDYTKYWFEKAIFDINSIGEIIPSDIWTSEYLPWDISNKDIQRNTYKNEGYEILQGNEIVKGCLIGGCIEVLEMIKGTEIWPSREQWENSILFIETSEDTPEPTYLEYWLRNYGSQGILSLVNGIVIGKPYDNKYYEEYKQVILKIVRDELGLKNLPIMYNMNFGHTSPIITIPYGCLAEIDCDKSMFKILETGVR